MTRPDVRSSSPFRFPGYRRLGAIGPRHGQRIVLTQPCCEPAAEIWKTPVRVEMDLARECSVAMDLFDDERDLVRVPNTLVNPFLHPGATFLTGRGDARHGEQREKDGR